MGASVYFTLAALIVLLMPIIVLPWEGQRAPDWLYALLGAGGLACVWVTGGAVAAAWSAGAALGCLVVVGACITMLRVNTGLQVLTGGHIKLLAAGATWLGFTGAVIMIAITIFVLFLIAAFQQVGSGRHRPDSSAVVAMAIVVVALHQQLPVF